MNLAKLQAAIGYDFIDQDLLLQALTHPSYANQHGVESYQRLEYLGDALIGFAVADELYLRYPDANEGILSKIRIELVKRATLSDVAREFELDKYALINAGSDGEKSRCDMYEAVTAAIYKDGGIIAATEFIKRTLLKKLDNFAMEDIKDFKSVINEKYNGKSIEYKTVNIGDLHRPYFQSQLFIDNFFVSKGEGKNKHQAEENCAENALKSN